MAGEVSTAGSANGALLERLRRQTTCPKCRERFKQPKLLPCNHSVCHDCLSLKKGVRKGLDYIVTCPACDKEAELTKTGLDGLPDAFFKRRMSQACTRLEKVVGGRGCEECGKEDAPLAAFCRDCDAIICGGCRSDHERLRSLSDHAVVGAEQYARELGGGGGGGGQEDEEDAAFRLLLRSRSSSATATMKCRAHGDPLKLYCVTCHVLICHDCTVKEHPQPRHKAELVDKLVTTHKTELEAGVATVRGHLAEARKTSSEKTALQRDIAGQKEELCRLLDHVFQELQLELEHRKRKLVREVEKKAEEEAVKVSQELSRAGTKTTELEDLICACGEALRHTTEQEFMVLHRDLRARLKEVSVKRPISVSSSSSPAVVELPSLSLSTSVTGEIESACKETALKSLAVSTAKSRVERVGAAGRAEVGREIQILFSAVTRDERPCIEPLELSARVTFPRFDVEVNSLVSPSLSIGTYTISFTPTKKGEHLVFVRVGSEGIESCPLCVPVRSAGLDLGQPQKVLGNVEWAWGVACGSEDRLLYVTESYNHCISVWDKKGDRVRTIGHKGHKPGQVLQPTGIAVSREGIIYVADGKDVGRIQKLSRSGHPLTHFTGLEEPHGVTLNAAEDRVYVCENGSQKITVFDDGLNLIETFGELSCCLDQGAHDPGVLESPHSLALDKAGNTYVTDTMGGHVHVYDRSGTHVRSIGHPHDEEFAPSGIAIQDEMIFTADRAGNQVVVFTTAGEFLTASGSYGTGSGQFQSPSGLAVDMDGYLYVCDYGNSRIQVF